MYRAWAGRSYWRSSSPQATQPRRWISWDKQSTHPGENCLSGESFAIGSSGMAGIQTVGMLRLVWAGAERVLITSPGSGVRRGHADNSVSAVHPGGTQPSALPASRRIVSRLAAMRAHVGVRRAWRPAIAASRGRVVAAGCGWQWLSG